MFDCISETTSLAEPIDASDMDQYKTIMFAGNFGLFWGFSLSDNGRTDIRTDGRTNKPSNRDARSHLTCAGGQIDASIVEKYTAIVFSGICSRTCVGGRISSGTISWS